MLVFRPAESEGERNHNYRKAFHPVTQETTYQWREILDPR